MQISNKILDKVEEMRILNGTPKWIGLSYKNHQILNEEIKNPSLKNGIGNVVLFLNLPVITVSDQMTSDGVYIHNDNEPTLPRGL